MLLDVGTIPQSRAVYKLYKAMYLDPNIGGCCGEISVHRPQLLNPIVASQHFEYKVWPKLIPEPEPKPEPEPEPKPEPKPEPEPEPEPETQTLP